MSNFRFIHLAKCGGTHTREVLNKFYNYREPSKDKNVTNIGVIRNPFSWYVSLWAFGCSGKGTFRRELLKVYPEAIELYADSSDVKLFRKWLKFVLNLNKKINDIDPAIMSKNQVGLMGCRFINEYGVSGKKIQHFIRMEHLSNDLIAIMKKLGYHIDLETQMRIKKLPKTNASKHLDWRRYYDNYSINLVKHLENMIIKKFGYNNYF